MGKLAIQPSVAQYMLHKIVFPSMKEAYEYTQSARAASRAAVLRVCTQNRFESWYMIVGTPCTFVYHTTGVCQTASVLGHQRKPSS